MTKSYKILPTNDVLVRILNKSGKKISAEKFFKKIKNIKNEKWRFDRSKFI